MLRGVALRSLGGIWVIAAFALGILCAALWFASSRAWDRHLTNAYVVGFSIYESLNAGALPPQGTTFSVLAGDDLTQALAGKFERLSDAPRPAYVTHASIRPRNADPIRGQALGLTVVSDKLQYKLSELLSGPSATPAEKMGQITRLLATFCSHATLYAHNDHDSWIRISGDPLWSCEARPRDYRLPAVFIAVVAIAIMMTQVANITATFQTFAQALHARRRLGGPEVYTTEGPAELRDIVDAVNSYLQAERESLSKRAVVLSGVSHDLGTPATRLRLRTALIEDDELRGKLEGDIDQMTGMIESALTYTRAELNVEDPRQLSLSSLVEALVADYQDTGRHVILEETKPVIVEGGASVFMSRKGHGTVPEDRRVLVTARPISLQRAISNLIDNALKYGRRATVALVTDAETATVIVEDEGTELSVEDIERLLAPFTRGDNTQRIDGTGLGLTIVATIATMHGGTLSYEAGRVGLRACFTIQR